jgi:glycosyltransferase involved in cell wall biosynthesis
VRAFYSFPTRLGTPGIGTTAWHQVTGLAEHGVDVTVACATCERQVPDGVRVIETLRVAGLKIPFRALGFMRAVSLHDRRAARVLGRMQGELNLVHCWPLGAERTLGRAAALGLPSLLERPNAHTRFAFRAVEEACSELGIPIDRSSPHYPRPERLEREEREYALAGRLLCPSDFVARSFMAEGVSEERLLRHRYGYDPTRFWPDGGPHLDGPFTAGFVGRVEPRKGLHLALRAWLDSGAAERGRFVIAGAIEPAYGQVLEPLMAHPSVEHHGQVSDPAALMRECDVLVLPSLEEGSALVTYEARGSGCVLVVSDRAGAHCTPDVDALVHPAGDLEALTRDVAELAGNRERLATLRAASLAGAPELTWSKAGEVLAGLYAASRPGLVERPV